MRKYELADKLYYAGWDAVGKRDCDPRGCQEWQDVVDLLTELEALREIQNGREVGELHLRPAIEDGDPFGFGAAVLQQIDTDTIDSLEIPDILPEDDSELNKVCKEEASVGPKHINPYMIGREEARKVMIKAGIINEDGSLTDFYKPEE